MKSRHQEFPRDNCPRPGTRPHRCGSRREPCTAFRDYPHSQHLDRPSPQGRLPPQRRSGWSPSCDGLGFDATLRDTTGHPMVVAHDPQARAARPACAVLRPLRRAAGRSARICGTPIPSIRRSCRSPTAKRGSSRAAHPTTRAQLMTFVEACRAWKAVTGSLPINVSMLLEGEEESGSPSLEPFLDANAGRAHGRRRARLRHRHVGPRDAGDHHHAARPRRRGDR